MTPEQERLAVKTHFEKIKNIPRENLAFQALIDLWMYERLMEIEERLNSLPSKKK